MPLSEASETSTKSSPSKQAEVDTKQEGKTSMSPQKAARSSEFGYSSRKISMSEQGKGSEDGSPTPQLNLDDVINVIGLRSEPKDPLSPLQNLGRPVEDIVQSPDAQLGALKVGKRPLTVYKEEPVIPLSEFRHPDLPTDYSNQKISQPISWSAVFNVGIPMGLTIGFICCALAYAFLAEVDPSSLAYINPLPNGDLRKEDRSG